MKGNIEDDLYFDRDEKGELIPEKFEIEIEGVKEEVFLKPLNRGELKRLFAGAEEDAEKYIILNNVINPKFTEEEFEIIQPEILQLIIKKVFEISGIKTEEKKDRKKEFEQEDEFGKKLKEVRERKKEGDLILFLHELGYNFYNINKLTGWEINWIIDCWNNREEQRKVKTKYSG